MSSCCNQANLTETATKNDFIEDKYYDFNLLDAHLWWRFFNVFLTLFLFLFIDRLKIRLI